MANTDSVRFESDQELVGASRRGDREAFGRLVERYQSLVCAVAVSATGDPASSEDLAQESFLTAWRKLEELEDPAKIRHWLCGITKNLGKNARRARHRQPAPLDAVAEPPDGVTPFDALRIRELQAIVSRALDAIRAPYREAVILYYREARATREVATILGITEAAARQRIHRGRACLRQGVEAILERGLRETRPTRRFAVAVVGALPPAVAPGGAEAAGGASAAAGGAGAAAASSLSLRAVATGIGIAAAVVVSAAAPALIARDGTDAERDQETDPSLAEPAVLADREANESRAERDRPSAVAGALSIAGDGEGPAGGTGEEDASARRWSRHPLVVQNILREHPEADLDGDGILSEEEVLAFQAEADERLAAAIAAALDRDHPALAALPTPDRMEEEFETVLRDALARSDYPDARFERVVRHGSAGWRESQARLSELGVPWSRTESGHLVALLVESDGAAPDPDPDAPTVREVASWLAEDFDALPPLRVHCRRVWLEGAGAYDGGEVYDIDELARSFASEEALATGMTRPEMIASAIAERSAHERICVTVRLHARQGFWSPRHPNWRPLDGPLSELNSPGAIVVATTAPR